MNPGAGGRFGSVRRHELRPCSPYAESMSQKQPGRDVVSHPCNRHKFRVRSAEAPMRDRLFQLDAE